MKYKIPFIITEHNSDILLNNFPNSIKEETRKIIKKSKNFNSVSNIASKKIASYFNIKKVDVLNNVIPEIFYKKFKRNKKKKFYFLSVSRFDKNKNVKMLIDVFINNFSNLNASLYIFGGGTDINMFKYYVKKRVCKKKLNYLVLLIEKLLQIIIINVIVLLYQVIKKLLGWLFLKHYYLKNIL